MIKCKVYILRCNKSGRYYTGQTKDIARRLKQHQTGKTVFGKRNKDISVVYIKEFDSKSSAQKFEYFIKRQKSHSFIDKLIRNQIILPR